MSAISNIYLIIFLPLISSLFCQLFGKKNISFWIAISSCAALFLLELNILPDVLHHEKIANDFELSALSIAMEFKLDILGEVFLLLITFLKIVILFYYRSDIEKSLDEKSERIFYAVYLLHLFALVGIFTTGNILNLFLFFEIYAFSFFATISISSDTKIAQFSFKYFCLNATSSLLILFCFLAIFLSLGEINFDKISESLSLLVASKNEYGKLFLSALFLLLSLAFFIKFFPFWLYFKKLKSSDLISNYLNVDSLFIKTNIGIFVALKFIYFFFGNDLVFNKFGFQPLLIFISLILIFYSAVKLHQQRHLKMIAAFFCLNNLGFILASIALQTVESLQAAFFYLLNFSLVNFLIFIFTTFLKRHFATSSINKIWLVNQSNSSLLIPLKILIFFIAAFPLSILFFANWYLAYASFNFSIAAFLLIALIVSNYSFVNVAINLIESFFSKQNSGGQNLDKDIKKYGFYMLSFWFLLAVIFLSSTFSDLSLRFASYILSSTI